jgi:hypothetical protein
MPKDTLPRLLITIDTEGDNLWSRPREITTKNAAYLPRFQQLCERFAFKPTWLTTHEMVCCPAFVDFARDALRRESAEVGMHLHAWNSPPQEALTADDYGRQPYLIEYPSRLMRDKVACLTDLLESTFEHKMISHRAGRWGFDAAYARLLIDAGYRVDCSVTPYVSWAASKGATPGRSGCDFSGFPRDPYFVDPDRIDHRGGSTLLELPMTIRPCRHQRFWEWLRGAANCCAPRTLGRLARRLFPPVVWLRPDGRNLGAMLQLLDQVRGEDAPYAQFMLHSSELMPGGSPRFSSHAKIERLYDDLERLFSVAAENYRGATLAEFEREFVAGRGVLPKTATGE